MILLSNVEDFILCYNITGVSSRVYVESNINCEKMCNAELLLGFLKCLSEQPSFALDYIELEHIERVSISLYLHGEHGSFPESVGTVSWSIPGPLISKPAFEKKEINKASVLRHFIKVFINSCIKKNFCQ